MFTLANSEPSFAAGRDPRWPDPGTWCFVKDLMEAVFDIDITCFPRHVVPVTIVSTLEWVRLNGVWVLRNSGIYQTDEPYSFVFEYGQCELSPDDIHIFRDAPERNQFAKRINAPGLSEREKEELIGYVRETGFYMWEAEMTRAEAAEPGFTPPGFIIERVAWCTLMWVLSQNGRDWLYCLDPIISSTYDFGVGYFYTPKGELLDPERVIVHKREPHSCRACGNTLWCVRGAMLGTAWAYVCVNCLVAMWTERPSETDGHRDQRIRTPPCPHIQGIDQTHKGKCRETCPHSGVTPELVWSLMEDQANQRVQARVAEVKKVGSNSTQQGGVTLNNLIEYFERGDA